MNETIVGKLPIRPQYRRFIEWRENLTADAPLQLPGKSPVCIFIEATLHTGLALMEYPRKKEFPYYEIVETYGDSLPFTITGPLANYDVFAILDKVARHLDDFIPSIMQEEVLARVTVGHNIGLSEKIIIEEFLTETGLFDHIDYEALKKRQQRFRSARSYVNYNRFKGNAVLSRRRMG